MCKVTSTVGSPSLAWLNTVTTETGESSLKEAVLRKECSDPLASLLLVQLGPGGGEGILKGMLARLTFGCLLI